MKLISLWWCLAVTISLCAEGSFSHTVQEVLSNIRQTRYEHKAFIDEAHGIYYVDCSSLVSFLLQKFSLQSYQALSIDKGHTRPRAHNFYDFFASLQEGVVTDGWQSVKTIDALERFDIIAWKYDVALGKKDTGHVVIVYDKPIKEVDGRYKIRVLDASKGIHANDTRAQQAQGGIGMGEMWFNVDEEGKPSGLYWSHKSVTMSRHKISMGRVLP